MAFASDSPNNRLHWLTASLCLYDHKERLTFWVLTQENMPKSLPDKQNKILWEYPTKCNSNSRVKKKIRDEIAW